MDNSCTHFHPFLVDKGRFYQIYYFPAIIIPFPLHIIKSINALFYESPFWVCKGRCFCYGRGGRQSAGFALGRGGGFAAAAGKVGHGKGRFEKVRLGLVLFVPDKAGQLFLARGQLVQRVYVALGAAVKTHILCVLVSSF